MILKQDVELPNGKMLVHLDVLPILGKPYHRTDIISADKKNDWFSRQIKKWVEFELTNFCNQREVALKQVGIYSTFHEAALNNIRTKVINYPLRGMYAQILQYQDDLRILLPSTASPHKSWIHVIEEIIHYAHDYIHSTKTSPYTGVSGKTNASAFSPKIQRA
jgi:hypothetical protein